VYGSNIVDNTISIETYSHLSNVAIQIFSISGSLCYKKEYNNLDQSRHSFDLTNIKGGIYFLNVSTPVAKQTLKFIKK